MDSMLYHLTKGTEQFNHFQHSGAFLSQRVFFVKELMYKRGHSLKSSYIRCSLRIV
jgi:hypothetical protein